MIDAKLHHAAQAFAELAAQLMAQNISGFTLSVYAKSIELGFFRKGHNAQVTIAVTYMPDGLSFSITQNQNWRTAQRFSSFDDARQCFLSYVSEGGTS